MDVFECICGARYKLPPGAEGRKVRCKRCGRVGQVPRDSEGPIPIADDSHAGFEAAAATASGSMFQGSAAGTALEDLGARPSPRVAMRPMAGFWQDVGWSLLFFTTPQSLIMFSLVWGLMTGVMLVQWIPMGWGAALLAGMFVTAWYMSIIRETASGEDDLPDFTLSHGWLDDVVIPALQYSGTWLLLLLPALVYAIVARVSLLNAMAAAQAATDPMAFIRAAGPSAGPLAALILAAVFLWPAALMCVSIGGLGSLLRIDLIVVSVVNTFLPYSAIVVLVGAATFLPGLITGLAAGAAPGGGAAAGGGVTTAVWLAIVACGVEAYFSIIVMRLIGLYYRHYKHELAWDWE